MPAWAIPLIMALAGAGSAASSSISSSKQTKSNEKLTKEQLAAEEAMQAREIALKESEMNPFRHQLAQAGSLSTLDQLERGRYQPVSVQGAAPYAGYKPQMSGGYSYERSPELVSAAGALKKDVLAGNRAPSVISPSMRSPYPTGDGRGTQYLPPVNEDISAVMDLLSMLYPDDPMAAKPRVAQKPRPPTIDRARRGGSTYLPV